MSEHEPYKSFGKIVVEHNPGPSNGHHLRAVEDWSDPCGSDKVADVTDDVMSVVVEGIPIRGAFTLEDHESRLHVDIVSSDRPNAKNAYITKIDE